MDLVALMDRTQSSAEVDEVRINAKPGWPFLLRCHPTQWEIATEGLDEPTALPIVMRQTLAVGCDGVRTLSKNERHKPSLAYEKAVYDSERRGFIYPPMTVEDPKHIPAGMGPGLIQYKYKCSHPRKGSGTYYGEIWDVPQQTAPGKPQRFRRDNAAFNRWRLDLVRSGIVPDIDDATFSELVHRAHGRLRRAMTVRHSTAEVHEDIVMEKRELVDIVEAMVTPMGAAPETSTRRSLSMTRAQLNTLAESLGIVDAQKLPSKAAVKAAIAEAREVASE